MRVISFVFCIFFSIFLILILSVGVQATEYKEIDANTVLTEIQKGKGVNYTGYHITGILDTSKIKLEPVSNIHYKKSPSDTGYLESEKPFIKGNIIFKDSHFQDAVVFTEVCFNNNVDFSRATFNSSADFSRATFNSSADFSRATFNSSADFIKATFNRSVYFFDSIFNGDSVFSQATFNSNVNFLEATFNRDSNFNSSIFNRNSIFSKATFNRVYFFDTNFKISSADFEVPETSKNIIADGENCEFIMKSYQFESRYTDANNIYYNYREYHREKKPLTDLSKLTDFVCWVTCGYGTSILHIIGCAVVITFLFAVSYANLEISLLYWVIALQLHAGSKFQILTPSEYNSKNDKSRDNVVSLKIRCKDPRIKRLSGTLLGTDEKESIASFKDALIFSTSTFTTLGSSKWYPIDDFSKWVTLEGVLGYIMLGIFLSTIGNILIKP